MPTSNAAPDTKKVSTGSSLKDGCYYMRYTPMAPTSDVSYYEGTLRVLRVDADGKAERDCPPGNDSPGSAATAAFAPRAGGDLYRHLDRDPGSTREHGAFWPGEDRKKLETEKMSQISAGTIPVFRRSDYQYYIQVIKIVEGTPTSENVFIRFSVHGFSTDSEWPNPGARTAWLKAIKAPEAPEEPKRIYPPGPDGGEPLYLVGNVLDEDSGQIVGSMTLGWVSKFLRRATVNIVRVGGALIPGTGLSDDHAAPVEAQWKSAFRAAHWQMNVKIGKSDLVRPPGVIDSWTIGELHQALFAMHIRQTVDATIIESAEAATGKKLEVMTLKEIRTFVPLNLARSELPERDWSYQLLCVEKIDGFDRGVTFDSYGSDSDYVPREASAVAAFWTFGEDEDFLPEPPASEAKTETHKNNSRWGSEVFGKKLQEAPRAYFRVAVHEIGHALGLDHNFKDEGFMCTTDAIAESGLKGLQDRDAAELAAYTAHLEAEQIRQSAEVASLSSDPSQGGKSSAKSSAQIGDASAPASRVFQLAQDKLTRLQKNARDLRNKQPFPNNIALEFHPEDLSRLRFGPDITIRPGAMFDDYGPMFRLPSVLPPDGLKLEIRPLLTSVPLGAPVRITLKLTNISGAAQILPITFNFKSGLIDGRVTDPDGNERTFWPLKKEVGCGDHARLYLRPGEEKAFDITLLRGAQQALFPMPGQHRVRVTATWDAAGSKVKLSDETSVLVTAAVDDNHCAAALGIISSPDALLSLVIGGEQFTEGNAAIEAAANNPILRPHFAAIHAKRLLLGGDALADNKKALDVCSMIDDAVVLSFDELGRLWRLLERSYRRLEEQPSESGAVQKPAVIDQLGSALEAIRRKLERLRLESVVDPKAANTLKAAIQTRLGKLPGTTDKR